MTAAEQKTLISVEEYLAGELLTDIKHEYVGGYVHAMAEAKNSHNRIEAGFFGALHVQLRGKPCQPCTSTTKVKIKMPTHTRFYYPDGMVVCEENPADDTFEDRPVILAEVLSKSTRRVDLGEKLDAYLTIPTLQVYLVIEQDSPRVTVYRRQAQSGAFEMELFTGLDATIPLQEIDAALPLRDLYERIKFPSD